MQGQIAWNELLTTDLEAAKAFYGQLLGWTFDPMPMQQGGTYWVAHGGGRPLAGMMAVADAASGTPPQWFMYVTVDDVDSSCKTVASAGGTVLREPFDIPDVGRIAVVLDAQGVGFGIMTPIPR